MADEGGRRPKRRCAVRATNKSALPSAVHYVGYVEEDETPEMIMRKFEELERVLAASKAAADTAGPSDAAAGPSSDAPAAVEHPDDGQTTLTNDQLLEVFKQTSIFNVKSALAGNEALLHGNEEGDEDDANFSDDEDADGGLWDEVQGFWSDEDDGDYKDHWKKSRRRKPGEPRAPRGPPRDGAHVRPRHNVVTHYNAVTQALIRRKVRTVDKDAIYQVRIPPVPIPLAWCRTIQPYVPRHLRIGAPPPKEGLPAAAAVRTQTDENVDSNGDQARAVESTYMEAAEVTRADFKAKPLGGREFQAVLIGSGWSASSKDGDQSCMQVLAKLPIPKLCPVGFIFIWAEKEHIHGLTRQLYQWGYNYVENLTWVFVGANNEILRLPSAYACKSHRTLYIFRREGQGKDIELRHQRNPDVTFDTIRVGDRQPTTVPEEAFVAIETLLPTGKGKFLELWAPKNAARPGWTHVCEVSK